MKTLTKISTFALLLGLMFTSTALAQDAKIVEIEGTNQMKFTVTEITAQPGQKITVKLTTVSKMPAVAMSHNFILLTADADVSKVAMASMQARDNDYIAPEMEAKIIAYTELAGGGDT